MLSREVPCSSPGNFKIFFRSRLDRLTNNQAQYLSKFVLKAEKRDQRENVSADRKIKIEIKQRQNLQRPLNTILLRLLQRPRQQQLQRLLFRQQLLELPERQVSTPCQPQRIHPFMKKVC